MKRRSLLLSLIAVAIAVSPEPLWQVIPEDR